MFNPIKSIQGAITGMKFITKIQEFLSGKKTYLSAIAIAVPAIVDIVNQFSDRGIGSIGGIMHSEAYVQLLAAIAAMSTRAAIAKAGSPAKEDPNYK